MIKKERKNREKGRRDKTNKNWSYKKGKKWHLRNKDDDALCCVLSCWYCLQDEDHDSRSLYHSFYYHVPLPHSPPYPATHAQSATKFIHGYEDSTHLVKGYDFRGIIRNMLNCTLFYITSSFVLRFFSFLLFYCATFLCHRQSSLSIFMSFYCIFSLHNPMNILIPSLTFYSLPENHSLPFHPQYIWSIVLVHFILKKSFPYFFFLFLS